MSKGLLKIGRLYYSEFLIIVFPVRKRPTFQDVYGNIPQTENEFQDSSPGIISTAKNVRISEVSWSLLPRFWTKYGYLRGKSPYSVRMRK